MISCGAIALIWIYQEQKLRRANRLSDLWNTFRTESTEIRREIELKFDKDWQETKDLLKKSELLEKNFKLDSSLSKSLLHWDRLFTDPKTRRTLRRAYKQEEELEAAGRILEELKEALESMYKTTLKRSDYASEDHYASLNRLQQKMGRLEQTSERVRHKIDVSVFRSRFLLYFLAIALYFLFAYWFGNLLIRAQTSSKQTKTPIKFTVLGDLGLSVKPEAARSDKVAVKLNFFPFSSIPTKGAKEEVIIGLGDNNNQEFEQITGTPEKFLEITQRSRKKVTLGMKVNATKSSHLLNAVSNPYVASVNLKEFSDVINNSNLIELECLIRNGQSFTDDKASRLVNRFPWETISIQVPIELSQPAYLSKVNIQRPSEDYVGDVIIDGLIGSHNEKGERSFIENGQNYQLNVGVQDTRMNIPANKHFVVKADFQRSSWQKFFLTWGQLVIAFVIGAILGIIAGRFRNTKIEFIVGGLGVLGLPFVIRSAVFSTYTTIPAVATGQGITIFELFFIGSFIIYAGAAFFFAWKFKKEIV